MLNVTLHLTGGETIALSMTAAQRDRVSRTMNLRELPVEPFIARLLEIPWRSISYLSSVPVPQGQAQVRSEAAD
ncbi:hypothetical protein LAJ19_17735 (plasmid) [Deinococcus taeanensis]|uniref:hypothetical protein n=1 Tax=Deinococcus taeanensis TaxID=2737050 RepID=UPI001CDBA784|nr:hypothetical protein [Deinococcus taeanensis]UBV44613.1 hypothetical protein LAJ19_17735 [Deinococcus taeanensis]